MRVFTIPGALLLVMALAMGCAEYEMGPTEVPSRPQTAKVPAKFHPSWKIAFRSDQDGDREIFVMNADGSGQTNLTNDAASDQAPSWSPNGKLIAFDSNRDGDFEIFVMNADGSGQTQLTTNAARDASPSWGK